jgi:hypothetical protein
MQHLQWKLSDQAVFDRCGLDAFVLQRFLRFAFQFFSAAAVLGIIVLVPVNATGGQEHVTTVCAHVDEHGRNVTQHRIAQRTRGLDLLSLSNVKGKCDLAVVVVVVF